MKTDLLRRTTVNGFTRLCALGCVLLVAAGASAGSWQQELDAGVHAREIGNIYDSIAALELAVQHAHDPANRARALTELGVTLTQAGRLVEAESILQKAYRQAPQDARYSVALALGNVATRARDGERAIHYYQDAIVTAPTGVVGENARVMAEINMAALRPANERLPILEKLLPRIEGMQGADYRARAFFRLGQEASEALAGMPMPMSIASDLPASAGDAGEEVALRPSDYGRVLQLSYLGFENAEQLGKRSGDGMLAVDAADALAQLYESQGHFTEAYEINRVALQSAAALTLGQGEFALVRLEWRAARLQHRRGDDSLALASYLRAADHLESIRQDLPIEDSRGNSTYQTLQRPLFVGLADLTLRDFSAVPENQQQARLARAVDVAELTHQAELQDYLGDRCTVESVRRGTNEAIAPGVAVIYPIVLSDRLEIIVRTNKGLLHHATPITSAALADEIQNLRGELLDLSSNDYLSSSRKLYEQLLAPFVPELSKENVRELIVVPDGYLRLIPFAALHDGHRFLVESFSISAVTGLSMTEPSSPRGKKPLALLAGLSSPGPVVDRLIAMGFKGDSELTANASSRGLTAPVERAAKPDGPPVRELALRSELALPGVKVEIQDLMTLARSHSLLDAEFTVARFQHEVQSGNYRVVHVASHGFFGGSADQSYLLAYDDVIKIGDLQRVIAVQDAHGLGIDLLTLSACDTATGDERAPLGFAGAAIKARAKSVVGTLWAVSDTATQQFMESFYTNLSGHGKAEALTQSQRKLLGSARFSHPYYWAPFVLTGDWN